MAAFCLSWRIKFSIAVQTIHNIERFHSATSHGESQKFLVPQRADREDRTKVIFSSCLDLPKALAGRVRTRSTSIAGREADRTDTNQVRTKATHGTKT